MKSHWKIYLVNNDHQPALAPNGKYHGIKFKDGFAYVNWRDLGDEHKTFVAIQSLGSDGRFQVEEIAEKDSQWGSK